MTESHLRLRSIRFKSGGELRVLHNDEGGPIRKMLRNHAAHLVADDQLAGYALVAWYRDSSTSTSVAGYGRPVQRFQIADISHAAITDYLTAP